MVLMNYESFIEDRIQEQKNKTGNTKILAVCNDADFK